MPIRDCQNPQFELGSEADFRVMAVGQKKYPCGYRLQRILDGVFALMGTHDLSADDITEIAIHVNGAFTRSVKFHEPSNGEEARLSLYHCVSAALAWGYVDIRAFQNAAITNPDLLSQRRKIRLVEHQEWGDEMIGPSDRVQITSTSGETHEILCEVAHGDKEDPLSRQETMDKFVYCTTGVIAPPLQQEVMESLYQLRTTTDIAPLMRKMAAIDGARL